MLSQALKGGVSSSSSCSTSIGLASSQFSCTASLLLDAECSAHNSPQEELQLAVDEDAGLLDSPKHSSKGLQGEVEPFWDELHHHHQHSSDGGQPAAALPSGLLTDDAAAQQCSIDALCRSFVASNSLRPAGRMHHSGMDIGCSPAAPSRGMHHVARSCPKPIVMPRRCRQGSLSTNQEELSVFIPPHEIAASSLMDPTNVSDSLCRKGSAAIRVRSGVLRRTGFLEGHTETLKPQTSVTNFRQ